MKQPTLIQVTHKGGKWHPHAKHRARCPAKIKDCSACKVDHDFLKLNALWCGVEAKR
jgi:hypothetical protein